MKFLRHNKDKFKKKPLPVDMSVMDQHLKLQQHQEEFLKWLEESERHEDDHDGYSYRKIR
mgnify:CR=1 FL=1